MNAIGDVYLHHPFNQQVFILSGIIYKPNPDLRNIMAFNEDSRVKIPALLHLTRLGYSYLSRKEHYLRQEETNIFKDIFLKSLSRINPGIAATELERHLEEISLKLDYDDLGREFYKALTATYGTEQAFSMAAEDAAGMERKKVNLHNEGLS